MHVRVILIKHATTRLSHRRRFSRHRLSFQHVATMRSGRGSCPSISSLNDDGGPGANLASISRACILQTQGLDCNSDRLNHFAVKDTMEGMRVAAAVHPFSRV